MIRKGWTDKNGRKVPAHVWNRKFPSGQKKKKRVLYHGTDTEGLAQAGITGGLGQGGKVYWTDDERYARLRADERASPGNEGVVLATDEEGLGPLNREGRHFTSQGKVPIRNLRVTQTRPHKRRFILVAKTGEVLGSKDGYEYASQAMREADRIAPNSPNVFIKAWEPKKERHLS